MALNEHPYEEYKGWYINRGITMPTQGIYEFNVYSSREKCAAEEPDYAAGNIEEARAWVDQRVLRY